MLLQLLYNNTPKQVDFVFAEPKLGLEAFGELEATKSLVWMQDPAPPGTETRLANQRPTIFLGRLAHMLTDQINEMNRRNEIFSKYGKEHIGASIGNIKEAWDVGLEYGVCLLYTSPSPRDQRGSRMPSSA